ncbi:hypothetical protein NMN90_001732 [Escherichia coli]|nr:hypothetical protein [Escherichia coli]
MKMNKSLIALCLSAGLLASAPGIDICPFHLYQQCKRQGVITPHSADFATTGASPGAPFFMLPSWDMSDFL